MRAEMVAHLTMALPIVQEARRIPSLMSSEDTLQLEAAMQAVVACMAAANCYPTTASLMLKGLFRLITLTE
jgi:hypothetical protein